MRSPAGSSEQPPDDVIKEAVRIEMTRARNVGLMMSLALTVGGNASAQAPSHAASEDELPRKIEINPSGVQMLRLAVPRADGDGESARLAVETMSKDMDITGLFQVLDQASFPAQLLVEGLNFSSALWMQGGA